MIIIMIVFDLTDYGIQYPWNIAVVVLLGTCLAITWNSFVAAKCPNEDCCKNSLYKETRFPSLLSNGYKCKACKKTYIYKSGTLSE